MAKTTAAITAVGGYVPEFVLTNQILETMVDTNDEWITNFIATHYQWTDKVKVINRSKASEEGSLENAAIEFLENTSEQFDSLSLLLTVTCHSLLRCCQFYFI